MKNFTVEEINLMCCFNTSSRKRLIDDMKNVTLNNMDGEIAELMYKTVRKLEAMTDAEFEELYIMPDGTQTITRGLIRENLLIFLRNWSSIFSVIS